VDKEDVKFSDGYLRSCGVLLIATNCQIVIGFAEILRSETKKEVVQALANVYHLAPHLPRLVVYDAGCLLVKFIKANYNMPNRPNSIHVTPETKILHDEVKWMIDRFHLQNHTEVYRFSVFSFRARNEKITSYQRGNCRPAAAHHPATTFLALNTDMLTK
jgi:hypothetical protein